MTSGPSASHCGCRWRSPAFPRTNGRACRPQVAELLSAPVVSERDSAGRAVPALSAVQPALPDRARDLHAAPGRLAAGAHDLRPQGVPDEHRSAAAYPARCSKACEKGILTSFPGSGSSTAPSRAPERCGSSGRARLKRLDRPGPRTHPRRPSTASPVNNRLRTPAHSSVSTATFGSAWRTGACATPPTCAAPPRRLGARVVRSDAARALRRSGRRGQRRARSGARVLRSRGGTPAFVLQLRDSPWYAGLDDEPLSTTFAGGS